MARVITLIAFFCGWLSPRHSEHNQSGTKATAMYSSSNLSNFSIIDSTLREGEHDSEQSRADCEAIYKLGLKAKIRRA